MKTWTRFPKAFASLAVLLALAGTAGAGIIVPTGLNPGDKYHLVFVTSATRDATSTDIADYNTHVQNAANAAGIGNTVDITWHAIGSTATVDARDNALISAPVYLLNGTTKVADGYADMWDGTLQAAINLMEDGVTTYDSATRVFTGSTVGGVKTGTQECLGGSTAWVGGGNPTATGGVSGQVNNWMDANNTPTKTSSHPLYALSQELTAPSGGMVLIVR